MSASRDTLPVSGSVLELTRALVDSPSPSGSEKELADLIERALLGASHLEVIRHGNTVAARTHTGASHRVVWAGHSDTVPQNNNLPSSLDNGWLWGRGTVDMKAGVAIGLKCAIEIDTPRHDMTWIFYDNEEVAAFKNGLGLFGAAHPDWVVGDFAILGEPTRGMVEAGCNGTLRAVVTTTGRRAHSARSWMGENAIHHAAEVLRRLETYEPKTVMVDGLGYREGLNAVAIEGGVAGNVIPDRCSVTVNYRFAPDTSIEDASAHVREVFDGFEVDVVDAASAAKPGLSHPLAQAFVEAMGVEVHPKFGWTDVARFSEWGIPAVNCGPGDPSLAHADDERVEVEEIEATYRALRGWLSGS